VKMRVYLMATLLVVSLVTPILGQEHFVDARGVDHWCKKSCNSPYFKKLRAEAQQLPRANSGDKPTNDLDKAEALIQRGDFHSARLLLNKHAELGNARALLLLGQSWDPTYLREKRFSSIQSDQKKAEELYARATEAFEAEAKAFRAHSPLEPKSSEQRLEPSKASLAEENLSTTQIFFNSLRAAAKITDEPQPIPPEIVALEPLLNGLLYRKRADGEIELLDASGVSLGTVKHGSQP
jgi:hypothetical protein